MNYKLINEALAEEFGKGNVELRKASGKNYEYTLWFLEDKPPKKKINRAKEIVGEIEPSFWYDEMAFHSEK